MKIGITGATGLLGKHATQLLESLGHEIIGFSRSAPLDSKTRRFADPLDVSGLDAVVHLAGEPIMGLWTKAKRQRILESRDEGTQIVARAIQEATDPPTILVSASGTNGYGHRGDDELTESEPFGEGFLQDVVKRWESAAEQAASPDTRVTMLRFGMILAREGGAGKMLHKIFRTGLAGRVGSGNQWMPWIHIEDAVRMIAFALETDSLCGPCNACSPHPVTNSEFTTAMASVANRPALIPAPAFALRLGMGELSQLALDSIRAVPCKLIDAGFAFEHPKIDDALSDLYGQNNQK